MTSRKTISIPSELKERLDQKKDNMDEDSYYKVTYPMVIEELLALHDKMDKISDERIREFFEEEGIK